MIEFMGTQQDHEQWDIVTSVGFTALLVAAGRAVEGHRDRPLVDDPWAARFVAAAEPPSTVPVRPEQSWELPILPAAAQEQLLRTIDSYSAPGSVIAAEHFANALEMMGRNRGMAALTAPFGVEATALASPEERTPAAHRLTELGWDVATRPSPDVARGYGRELGTMPDGTTFSSDLVTATKG